MVQLGRCVCLLPRLRRNICGMISEFDDQRCGLCGTGKGIWVKDSSFVWQWWCMGCAVTFVEDSTRRNIHAKECSLDANHSAVFENISLCSDSILVDFEEEYCVDSDEDHAASDAECRGRTENKMPSN